MSGGGAAPSSSSGGSVTKIHWGRVGGVGAFAGGLLLFVAGIAVGGEGEYLMERERMSRIVEHDHELESGMEALKMKYDHDLSESTAGLRDELDKEKAKEKELEEELEAEHQVRKRYLQSVLCIKMIILPRQARDKNEHRESTRKRVPFSCSEPRGSSCSAATGRALPSQGKKTPFLLCHFVH